MSRENVNSDLKELLDIISIFYWWKDEDGHYKGCNQQLAKLLGLGSEADIIDKTDFQLPWSEFAEELVQHDKQVMNSRVVLTREEIVIDRQGDKHYFLVTKAPLFENGKDSRVIGTIGTSIEITDLKRTQAELEEKKIKAEIANKAKTEFLYNMRHDIRTPFSGILSLTQHLADNEEDPDKKEKLNEIAKAADTFLVYLNEILELSQIETDKTPIVMRVFDLKELTQSMVDAFLPSVELHPIELAFNYQDAPELIIGDQFRIQRILINLLSNAVKFTQKGQIRVDVKEIERMDRKVILQIAVTDTGIGIPQGKEDVIFEKFTRLESKYKSNIPGSGLGLYAVKSIVNDLDGDIIVKSELGKGSSFICVLPFKLPATANKEFWRQVIDESPESVKLETVHIEPQHTKQHQTIDKCGEGFSVLLVEDNRLAQLAATSILGDLEFYVDVVSTATAALKLISQQEYDLILLDIGLPDIDGYQLADAIRSHEDEKALSRKPIVIVSAHVDQQQWVNHRNTLDGYIVKPLSAEKINEVVQNLLRT